MIKTKSNRDYLSINTQDLKTVTIVQANETAVIVTSSSKTNLACMTKHQNDRFVKELASRYNILHLPSGRAETSGKDNTILLVEDNGKKTYIWPKALFSVSKLGTKLTIKAFQLDIELDDPQNLVKAETLTKFDGFVKI